MRAKTSVYVDEQVWAKLKAWCALNKALLSETVEQIISKFLEEKERQGK